MATRWIVRPWNPIMVSARPLHPGELPSREEYRYIVAHVPHETPTLQALQGDPEYSRTEISEAHQQRPSSPTRQPLQAGSDGISADLLHLGSQFSVRSSQSPAADFDIEPSTSQARWELPGYPNLKLDEDLFIEAAPRLSGTRGKKSQGVPKISHAGRSEKSAPRNRTTNNETDPEELVISRVGQSSFPVIETIERLACYFPKFCREAYKQCEQEKFRYDAEVRVSHFHLVMVTRS